MKAPASMLQVNEGLVVESGDNANGQYRIWGDGTIIYITNGQQYWQ